MVPVNEALEAILNAVYGKDVRQALHDGLYQVNRNANLAVQTARAIGVGTLIIEESSPSGNYVIDNLYLNNATWDLWKCTGDAWELQGNIKGAEGDPGDSGEPGAPGTNGTNAYVHIRYSTASDGTGFVATPSAATKYIGIYAGTSAAAPADKTAYAWSKYVGDSGTGSGDMQKSVYDTDDDGKVDAAEDADKLGGQLPEYYQTALDDATTTTAGKMSAADKEKLDGIADNANNYSLPSASSSVKGGIKVGAGLEMAEDGETLTISVNETMLTKTLTASETSITFTDDVIVTGNTVKIGIETSVLGLNYTEGTISTGSLVLTYPAQATDTTIWITIKEVD
ncbi:MAG: hypothetical protein QM697_00145 [Lachnospiraceae bacterium]